MAEETMCYVARFSGKPGFGFIAVDLPEHAKDNAKELSKLIRGGATIERVTIDAARDGIREFLEHKRMGGGRASCREVILTMSATGKDND